MTQRLNGTSTSNFGVGRRESHDASDFYSRFTRPEQSEDDFVPGPVQLATPWIHGDIRHRDDLADGSVALVVTSPPYFVGKEYEQALGEEGVPATYIEYLDLLRSVFGTCKAKLEPGGRIAVNVANLGRRPYRSLAADVIRILQDDLKLLLRGEVIWKKADGASGNCAWGSFRSAANPVLRDTTERVVIASKGRFDRARSTAQRQAEGLPHQSWISNDEFLEATLDVWDIPSESARRVQHPAPFPVELPERLINLYTFRGDLVVDPFMGSGSTLVAAARTGRCYAGYDLDERYVAIARQRVEEVASGRRLMPISTPAPAGPPAPAPGAGVVEDVFTDDTPESYLAQATHEGRAAQAIAERVVEDAGFHIVKKKYKVPRTGVAVSLVAEDNDGRTWYFDVTGAFTSTRGGLLRSDTMWKCLGRAHVLQSSFTGKGAKDKVPLVLLTSHLPRAKSEGHASLHAAGPSAFFDAIEMLSGEGQQRLALYAKGGHGDRPLPGLWATSPETSA
ncbi:MAG TPA: site-specific DNA-methyltransferase [Acidimicrobiales bacterium]|nr:site-specific DNA-methyltransferase [Acidimicrobiales bacterium]